MILPSAWQMLALADVCRVYSGGTPSRSMASYWGGHLPWVSTTEIDGSLIISTRESITEAGLTNSAAKIAPAGTLLMAMYGQGKTRGKCSKLGIDSAMNQACAAIEPGDRIDPDYLLAYLQHSYEAIRGLSNSGSQENLSGEIVKRIPVIVPPLSEQHRIAAAVADADDLIATFERLIAKKQTIKQGMMQQLLTGRTRLPGFTAPWAETSISDVANVDPEALTAYTDSRALIDYISLEDVGRGEILGHTRARFDFAPSRARRVIREGDVLFGTVRPNLQSHAMYRGGLKSPIASTGFSVVRAATERSAGQFLFYLLMSHLTTVQVDRIIAGSNYPAVSSGDVRRLTFMLPSLDEQQAIGSVLADCDDEISLLGRRLAKAREVKSGMMQQLLTGRSRLNICGGSS